MHVFIVANLQNSMKRKTFFVDEEQPTRTVPTEILNSPNLELLRQVSYGWPFQFERVHFVTFFTWRPNNVISSPTSQQDITNITGIIHRIEPQSWLLTAFISFHAAMMILLLHVGGETVVLVVVISRVEGLN